jgi:ribosomal protein S18 acetylase RimI-like enzyme
MTEAFTIRPATENDVPLVLQFVRELADYAKLSHEVVVDEARLRGALFGARPHAEVLLGFVGNEPAAFAVFFQNFSTFLGRPGIYLEDLFVRPNFRRRGFGRTMLEHLAREANRRECGRFEWSVLDWNAPAIAFYEKLGAAVMKEWRICRLTGDALARFGT